MLTEEKGREAKSISALGRRRPELDHTPKNADTAKCLHSRLYLYMVAFISGDGPLYILSE